MPKKSRREKAPEVWVNPKSNLKGARGDRGFDNRFGDASAARILELADIALGLKKPQPKKKRAAAASGAHTSDTHTSEKTEPYSS
jgi:hypothetical protein